MNTPLRPDASRNVFPISTPNLANDSTISLMPTPTRLAPLPSVGRQNHLARAAEFCNNLAISKLANGAPEQLAMYIVWTGQRDNIVFTGTLLY